MNAAEYQMTQQILMQYAQGLLLMDLPAFLEAISRAESAGPILDPTLYRDAQGSLHEIKEIATGFNDVRHILLKFRKEKEEINEDSEPTDLS